MSEEDDEIRKFEDIEKIRKSRKDLEAAVSAIPDINEKYDKLMSELCVGPDCLKNKVQEKFGDIDEKIKKIEEKQSDLACDRCGYVGVPVLSSFCPQCGAAIYSWNDDEGAPIKGWRHWTERNKT
jgi:ribosomal protein L37E